jgi:hypothetical protein
MGLFEDAVKTLVDEGKKAVDTVKDAASDGKDAVVDATSDAVDKVTDEGKKAADRVSSDGRRILSQVAAEGRAALDQVAAEGRRAADAIAAELRRARDNINQAGAGLGTPPPLYRERLLTDDEKNLARAVFEKTLPYGAIYLSNGVGLGGRAYTIPHPAHVGSYVIHIGPAIFKDATDSSVVEWSQPGDAVFIHELTHVWQGVHRKTPFDYMVDSVYNQIRYGASAYEVKDSDIGTKKWSDFTAEQQAMIVEDWYIDGSSTTDKRFKYITENIRAGQA